jgi:hypothetical protein
MLDIANQKVATVGDFINDKVSETAKNLDSTGRAGDAANYAIGEGVNAAGNAISKAIEGTPLGRLISRYD